MNTQETNFKTDAQKIFGGKTLITSRPEGMAYETYHLLRAVQSKMIKKLFKRKPSRKLLNIIR